MQMFDRAINSKHPTLIGTMRVRLRCGPHSCTVVLSDSATVADFVSEVSNATHLAPQFRIKLGFPPAVVDLSDTQALVQTVGVVNGVSLIVEPIFQEQKISVQRHEISSDNSCLFNAIGFVVDLPRKELPHRLRKLVASSVLEDQAKYNAAILGKLPSEYAVWITKSETWGGEIELQILSVHLNVQIRVVDIQTLKVYRYGAEISQCVYLCKLVTISIELNVFSI